MVGGLGATAYAVQGNATVAPNNVSPAGGAVTISYTGWSPTNVVFINQCVKNGNTAPVFNYLTDCTAFKSINPNTNSSGAGSATFQVFAGDDPVNELWACGATSAVGNTPTPTCFLRITDQVQANTTDDQFYPVTFTAADPQVPEVPLNVLLPASAAAVLGAGLLIARKRQLNAAA